MLALLVEPFTHEFMLKALLAAALIGAMCALLSVFLLLKGWSLIGDALSHSVVPGVAVAYALALPYALSAFFTAMLSMLAMLCLKRLPMLRQDAVIGFVFTSFFALGLLIVSLNPTGISINAIIHGQMLTISDRDFWQVVLMSALVIVLVAFFWRTFMLYFFDEMQMRASGFSPLAWQLLFFSLVSVAVVAALQAVGAILVIALLIAPGASAFLLSKRFFWVLCIAFVIGACSAFLGAYLSYFMDTEPASLIVLLQVIIFILAFIIYRMRHRHEFFH